MRSDDPVSPEGIARTLGLETTSAFEDLLLAKAPASFGLLERFAARYGFDPRWLEDGSGSMFTTQSPTFVSSLRDNAYELGVRLGYCDSDGRSMLRFHFVLFEGAEQLPIRLLIGNGQYGWIIVDGNWYLDHKKLGEGGQGAQLDFYEQIKKLKLALCANLRMRPRFLELHLFEVVHLP